VLTANALEAAGEILIPVDTSALGIDALEAVLGILRQSIAFGCKIIGNRRSSWSVATVPANNISKAVLDSLLGSYPLLALKNLHPRERAAPRVAVSRDADQRLRFRRPPERSTTPHSPPKSRFASP